MTIPAAMDARIIEGNRRGLRDWPIAIVAGLAACVAASGCAYFAAQPEINPDRLAPSAMGQEWLPKDSVTRYEAPPAEAMPSEAARGGGEARGSAVPQQAAPEASGVSQASGGSPYDLAALIDMALRNNPSERSAWESARASAAAYGAARSPYYPL